jgi:heme exporter protein A
VPPTEIVRAEELLVARGRTVLLEGFSLALGPGEAVHLAGPNGCGKSSLLRILAGVAEPRRGTVRRTVPCVYVPERLALPESLAASRWLRIVGAQAAALPSELDRRCGALSKGQLQRLVITGALDGAPPRPGLYVLDEPWAGLDGLARSALDRRLAGLVAGGATVLYTDHSGAGALAATRSVRLGPEVPARATARITLELTREGERMRLTVDDADLASAVGDGWRIEGGEVQP